MKSAPCPASGGRRRRASVAIRHVKFSLLALTFLLASEMAPAGTAVPTPCAVDPLPAAVESASRPTDGAPEAASGYTPKPPVRSSRAMIVAANPLATAAGCEVLLRGGNAVDAAVAAIAVLGLVEPQSAGLGGGGFLLAWNAKARRLTQS